MQSHDPCESARAVAIALLREVQRRFTAKPFSVNIDCWNMAGQHCIGTEVALVLGHEMIGNLGGRTKSGEHAMQIATRALQINDDTTCLFYLTRWPADHYLAYERTKYGGSNNTPQDRARVVVRFIDWYIDNKLAEEQAQCAVAVAEAMNACVARMRELMPA